MSGRLGLLTNAAFQDRRLRALSFHMLFGDSGGESRGCGDFPHGNQATPGASKLTRCLGASSIHEHAAFRVSKHSYSMILRIDLPSDLDLRSELRL